MENEKTEKERKLMVVVSKMRAEIAELRKVRDAQQGFINQTVPLVEDASRIIQSLTEENKEQAELIASLTRDVELLRGKLRARPGNPHWKASAERKERMREYLNSEARQPTSAPVVITEPIAVPGPLHVRFTTCEELDALVKAQIHRPSAIVMSLDDVACFIAADADATGGTSVHWRGIPVVVEGDPMPEPKPATDPADPSWQTTLSVAAAVSSLTGIFKRAKEIAAEKEPPTRPAEVAPVEVEQTQPITVAVGDVF